ncbi:MAG: hypothetical protein A3D74_01100 [Candidatus Levybacteria bacterium RIFCSPHIGHO2_02_FULL_37_13]|nr:MAG: hypothetical protein A3D74_01100 [Candidatus Levybacteria bacterium RIFCSPHIGHO2_02_FULL_37_13]OGH30683.1 MAG: hypothetical protein A3E40_04450 [Candidatus Levybacteria bacterium RIFCSPHIGHO2_12_FULL_37_9]
MIFIDASSYLSSLLPKDPNLKKAVEIFISIGESKEHLVTSYAILGEVLTVSSQRYDRQTGIKFVEDILDGSTKVILEDDELMRKAFKIFQEVEDKDVSWVDCYSFAIIEYYKIDKVFSFDKDFKKHTKSKFLE